MKNYLALYNIVSFFKVPATDFNIYDHTIPPEQLCGETSQWQNASWLQVGNVPEQELHWTGRTVGTHLEFIHILPRPHLAPFGTCPGSISAVYKWNQTSIGL